SPDLSLFASGNYFDEDRGNGTPLQFNRTGAGAFATGGRLRAGDFGELAAAVYGHFQEFRSTFSTQAADRNSETLALDQTVPSTSAGGYLQWSRRFGSHLVASGGDIRWVDGETQEKVYVSGAFARTRIAALFHATSSTDVRASAYQGFRVPTLNELYRVFRVRNDVTVANEHLRPERLTGGELGVQQRWGPLEARVTAFWNEVRDLVANVTLAAPLPDCPTGTTCRQRQNLDLARIRGFESELELRPTREWRLLASYLFSDARVVEAAQQPTLEGRRLAQVPEHNVTLGVRYAHPAIATVSATARYVGGQFEDDQNTLPLGGYVVLDVFVSRALARWAEAFVGVENLFDQPYATGRTSEGV